MYYVHNAHPLASQERDYVQGEEDMNANVFRDIEQPARRRPRYHRRAGLRRVELPSKLVKEIFSVLNLLCSCYSLNMSKILARLL